MCQLLFVFVALHVVLERSLKTCLNERIRARSIIIFFFSYFIIVSRRQFSTASGSGCIKSNLSKYIVESRLTVLIWSTGEITLKQFLFWADFLKLCPNQFFNFISNEIKLVALTQRSSLGPNCYLFKYFSPSNISFLFVIENKNDC